MMRVATWAVALAPVLGCVVFGSLAPRVLAQGSEFDNPNVVLQKIGNEVGYLTPKDPQFNAVRDRLAKRRLLEEFRAFISPLRLPKTLNLVARQCPEGPHYNPNNRSINWCYEFTPLLDKVTNELMSKPLPKGLTYTKQEVNAGMVAGIMIHELGHALFDILDVPVFGREEDGADQLAAFIALQFSPDVARTVVRGFALLWLYAGDPPARVSQRVTPRDKPTGCHADPVCAYSDEHGTGSQRMYNTLCLAYGRDPALFKDLVDSGWLPKARAANCAEEYQQVRHAFQRTILPFIDEEMMKKVRARKWFMPGETETLRK